MKLSSRKQLLNEADKVLRQIHEDKDESWFDAEDVISTMSTKGEKIEYFRIDAISPSGKEVSTGWLPAKEKTIRQLTQELEREMYKIVRVEKKSETV